MNAKVKSFLHGFISIVGNLIVLGVMPVEYKGWALLAFNLAQALYAFYDPTYTLEVLGRKMGRAFTKEDLK